MPETCIVCLGDLLPDVSETPPTDKQALLDAVHPSRATTLRKASTPLPSTFDDETIALLLPCGHTLHNECLRPWVERANSCPICRASFNGVQLMARLGGPMISSYDVEDKQQVAELDLSMLVDDDLSHPSSEPCMICDSFGGHDQLLLCDICDRPCHVFCAGLDDPPAGNWYCQNCTENPFGQGEPERGRQPNLSVAVSHPSTRALTFRSGPRTDSWVRIWQEVNRRTGIDLDFPFDDDVVDRAQHEASQREMGTYQARLRAAERRGNAARIREPATVFLSTSHSRPETPAPGSQDELRAWNAFEKAREVAYLESKRQRRSPSRPQSGVDPKAERTLKRPCTRRATATPGSNANDHGESSSTTARGGAAVAATANHTDTGSNFLQSLLKEVETSIPASDCAGKRLSKLAAAPSESCSPQQSSSSLAGSPVGSGAAPQVIRVITSPSPSPTRTRPSSPLLSSTISPVFPSAPQFPPFSPTGDDRSARRHSGNSVDRSQRSAPATSPRSEEASPTRANMSFSTKTEIQRMVKAALKRAYGEKQVSKEEYTDINMNISRLMYEWVGDAASLADQSTREKWQQIAFDEVDKAVKLLRADGLSADKGVLLVSGNC